MSYPIRFSLAATLFFAVLAGLPASAADNGTMIGRWFAEGEENGAHIQVFMDNRNDGTYLKEVRGIDGCDVLGTGKETGVWTFDKGDFATESKEYDGRPVTGSFADTHDLFTVTRVDADHINLYDTETNITWALSRVTQTAPFPSPRGCNGI